MQCSGVLSRRFGLAALIIGLASAPLIAAGRTPPMLRPLIPSTPEPTLAPSIPRTPIWEPNYAALEAVDQPEEAQAAFLQAVADFLAHEGMEPSSVQIEVRPLGRYTSGWRALAQVFVDRINDQTFSKRLVFEPGYWLSPAANEKYANHRWTKILWHEIHHLNAFPINLQKAGTYSRQFPPAQDQDRDGWERQWIALLEPIEELAAERSCIERYRKAFGPLTDELLRDSRGDMRKYAALYQERLHTMLQEAADPNAILQQVPSQLPIDPDGNILTLSSI